MNVSELCNKIRTSNQSRNRWKKYPEISSIVEKSFLRLFSIAKEEGELPDYDIRMLTNEVISEASRNYPIRTVSSILNKLRADLEEFIVFLENELPVSEGYEFISARTELGYFANFKQYTEYFVSRRHDDQFKILFYSALDGKFDKNATYRIMEVFREAYFNQTDINTAKNNIKEFSLMYPQLFTVFERTTYGHKDMFFRAFIQACCDPKIWINEEIVEAFSRQCSTRYGEAGEVIVDYITGIEGITDEQRVELLNKAHRVLINLGMDSVIQYFKYGHFEKDLLIPDKYRWALDVVAEKLIAKAENSSESLDFAEAAIAFQGAKSEEHKICLFWDALRNSTIFHFGGFKYDDKPAFINHEEAVKEVVTRITCGILKADPGAYRRDSIEHYSLNRNLMGLFRYLRFAGSLDKAMKAYENASQIAISKDSKPWSGEMERVVSEMIYEFPFIEASDFKTSINKKRYLAKDLGL